MKCSGTESSIFCVIIYCIIYIRQGKITYLLICFQGFVNNSSFRATTATVVNRKGHALYHNVILTLLQCIFTLVLLTKVKGIPISLQQFSIRLRISVVQLAYLENKSLMLYLAF